MSTAVRRVPARRGGTACGLDCDTTALTRDRLSVAGARSGMDGEK